MAKELLLEIGSEELPAGFIDVGRRGLEELLKKALRAHSLEFARIYTLATPRRLTAVVEGLAEKEPDRTVELKGPAKRSAYRADGKPSKALEGFMRSQGLKEKDLKVVETPKGEYIYGIKEIKGRPTETILPEILSDVVCSLSFPKTMRWKDLTITYPRPLHWLLAVYGGKVVEFSFGPVRSSNTTRGHRFMAPEEFSVDCAKTYIEELEKRFVVVSPERRKEMILKQMRELAQKAGGVLIEDPSLLDEVAGLVEYPVVIMGRFDEGFLSMPEEVVINAMREHQRYFGLKSPNGRLLPAFITVANTPGDIDTIRRGNERVLRARLNDARFYFEKDKKISPIERVEELKGVVFQARLGTSYQKVERFTRLALFLAESLGVAEPPGERPPVEEFLTERFNPAVLKGRGFSEKQLNYIVTGRASMLAKSDLTSGMVGEFPALQGIMGREYARLHGEAPPVYNAIYEHYLPQHAGDRLPSTHVASIVGIADRLDTVVGCFAVGVEPTGTQDPYGLRRHALAIIAIVLEKGYRIGLDVLVKKSAELLEEKLSFKKERTITAVLEFFRERLRQRLLSQGLSHDSVDAVLSTPWFDMVDTIERIKALEEFKTHPDFAGLITAFKRVSNILKGISPQTMPDETLFREGPERELFSRADQLRPVLKKLSEEGNYRELFSCLAGIKESVDRFFDGVKVMAEDERIRENRLSLLNFVRSLYIEIADLSKITVQM